MGIPKFFRWISERYPLINQDVTQDSIIPEFDNLYLDFNGVIHRCTHPDDGAKALAHQLTMQEMVLGMFQYVDQLFRIIKPKKLLMIAVDGVAPRAKMNQQRSRRFRSARDARLALEEAKAKGMEIPDNEADIFDSNCITPGTAFMYELSQYFEFFFRSKISDDPAWKDVKVIFSGQDVPGEGEHKIMEYIRKMKAQPGWDPNNKHCMYGLDADLIMLGLVTHEPHFALLREEVYSRKKGNFGSNSQGFQMLHLSILREYLDHEFSSATVPFGYDLERIIDDFVFLCYFIGNDFLPNLPFLDIADNALNRMLAMYKSTLPLLDTYLTCKGEMNMKSVETFLVRVSSIERECLEMIAFEGGDHEPNNDDTFDFDGGLDDDEAGSFDLAAAGAAGDQLRKSVQLEEGETAQEHSWRNVYYMNKFQRPIEDADYFGQLKYTYMEGLAWVLRYYYDGCVSWGWFYPYHYAPLASDLRNLTGYSFKFELGEPFRPFQQLLSVLPIPSAKFLPPSYQKLMRDEDSALHTFYPADFEMDQNGKKNDWEAVVIIPFIDAKLLQDLSNAIGDDLLTEVEIKRNSNEGKPLLFYFNDLDRKTYKSPFPSSVFSDIYDCACSVERFELPSVGSSVFDLCPGVKMGLDAPACFPTLYTLPHTARPEAVGVTVFGFGSKRESMVVTLTHDNVWETNSGSADDDDDGSEEVGLSEAELDRRDAERLRQRQQRLASYAAEEAEAAKEKCKALAKKLLNKVVYVDWPYHREGRVVELVSGHCRITRQGSKGPLSVQVLENDREHASFWRKQSHMVESKFRFKKAVELGELQVLLKIKQLSGLKLLPSGEISKDFSLLTDYYPYQAVVEEVHNRDQRYEGGKRSAAERFQPNTPVVLTCKEHYGSIGRVRSLDGEKATVEFRPSHSVLEVGRMLTGAKNTLLSLQEVARKLRVSSKTVSQLTAAVYVGGKGNSRGTNVGLQIKFSGKGQKVSGYAEKPEGSHGWMFTPKALVLLEEYQRRFPEVFQALQRSHDGKLDERALYPHGNAKKKLQEVKAWISSTGVTHLPRSPISYHCFSTGQIGALQGAVDEVMTARTQAGPQPSLTQEFPIAQLQEPITDELAITRQPYDLGDRVVYVKAGGKAPFGARGTIIGSDKSNGVVSVLFDKQFIGGSSLGGACAPLRGLEYIAPRELINVSSTPFSKKKRSEYKQGNFQDLRTSGGRNSRSQHQQHQQQAYGQHQQQAAHGRQQQQPKVPRQQEQKGKGKQVREPRAKEAKAKEQAQPKAPKAKATAAQPKPKAKAVPKPRQAPAPAPTAAPATAPPVTGADPSAYWLQLQAAAGAAPAAASAPAAAPAAPAAAAAATGGAAGPQLKSPEDFGRALLDLLSNPSPVAAAPPAALTAPAPSPAAAPNAGTELLQMLQAGGGGGGGGGAAVQAGFQPLPGAYVMGQPYGQMMPMGVPQMAAVPMPGMPGGVPLVPMYATPPGYQLPPGYPPQMAYGYPAMGVPMAAPQQQPQQPQQQQQRQPAIPKPAGMTAMAAAPPSNQEATGDTLNWQQEHLLTVDAQGKAAQTGSQQQQPQQQRGKKKRRGRKGQQGGSK
mmetsp:Transcript_22035/g.86639  ORF Transcript_22035/g.86639 Transcript_22035/m.86639 type:complete len:1581 (+) Transcript_22035:131-4873(+)